MSTTLLSFKDKYYMYDGDREMDERGFTIGGYESAWLADLAMSYLLDNIDQELYNGMQYFGIYRDDGIAFFDGIINQKSLSDWLLKFQREIERIAGNEFLKFTAVIWKPDEHMETELDPAVQVCTDSYLPYLDTEIFWNSNLNLQFRVHLKPNQQLKYLNRGSSHTPGCFKAIPTGVCKRLAKLTTLTEENKNKKMDELYPVHFGALSDANLLDKIQIPTLEQQQSSSMTTLTEEESAFRKKRQTKDRKRMTFFKIGYNDFWKKPIHTIINEIKRKFPSLSWLQIRMSYHRFLNIRELLQGDLGTKLCKGIQSWDFATLQCNCRKKTTCQYDGKCRTPIVVYKATCQKTGKAYIGNTQQFVKKRMQQHVQDVRKLVISEKNSDSFAAHFANQVPQNTEKKAINGYVDFRVELIWKGDPLTCVKTFGTRRCKLCAKERLEIIKMCKFKPNEIINKCNEVYGACRHKPKFHRFDQHPTAGTDESKKGRKGHKAKKPKKPTSTKSTKSESPRYSYSSDDTNSVSSEIGIYFLTGKTCKEVCDRFNT